jgi:phage N-6-adenine-methyltransferase
VAAAHAGERRAAATTTHLAAAGCQPGRDGRQDVTQLERLTQAERMLAEVRADVIDGRNAEAAMKAMKLASFAEAARVWAQQSDLGTRSVNHATVIKINAERCMADAVEKGQKAKQIATPRDGGRPPKMPSEPDGIKPATLGELGIEQPRLSEAKKLLRAYTDNDLAQLEDEANDAGETLSRTELLRGRSNAQRMQSSETNEWYTPAPCIEAARRVMGGIDLDPASSEKANRTVQAARYFTKDDNGLSQPWKGRLWLNPPYGGLAGQFIERLAERFATGDVTAAVALVSSHSTDTAWFRPLWDRMLCFTYGRIQFVSSDGRGDAATHGSVFAYFGDNGRLFAAEFSQFGAVMSRWA